MIDGMGMEKKLGTVTPE